MRAENPRGQVPAVVLDVACQPVQGRRLRRRGHQPEEEGEGLVGLGRAAVAAGLGVEELGVEGGPDLLGQGGVAGLVVAPPQGEGQLARQLGVVVEERPCRSPRSFRRERLVVPDAVVKDVPAGPGFQQGDPRPRHVILLLDQALDRRSTGRGAAARTGGRCPIRSGRSNCRGPGRRCPQTARSR